MNYAKRVLRSKSIKVLVGVFLMANLFWAIWNEALADSPDNLKPNINPESSPINKSQIKITATNPNQAIVANPNAGGVNHNQGVNFSTRPQYRQSVYNSNRATNMGLFNINAFFNRITSSVRTKQTQAAIDVQNKSMQYNPSQNTSVMDYIRTKILRLQK